MRRRPGARRGVLAAFAGLCLAGGALVDLALDGADVPPRSLATFLDAIDRDEHPRLAGVGAWAGRVLGAADRGAAGSAASATPLLIGAQPVGVGRPGVVVREVRVSSIDAARRAFDTARPGDVITFAPGTYRVDGAALAASRPATAEQPIVVRADTPGQVVLEVDAVQAIVVSAPAWIFENLHIRGVCARDSDCEHAFHVVAAATRFVARNNTVIDFNAHFKINGQDGLQPDAGVIEGNTLRATRPRATGNPVTDIDLVGASGWTVRNNRISDFVKASGNQVSYGAFFKGGGAGNRFERNLVVCEERLTGQPGARVGLSLGGGGTDPAHCRDGRCVTEQDGGVLAANLVVACSDDGIYLNRAATSAVVHNTLVDTGGIVVRFPESSAVVEGNLVDGMIRSRDGSALHANDNLQTGVARLYLGEHPLRGLFANPGALDFRWRRDAPRRQGGAPAGTDLCGTPRPEQAAYGAVEDFSRCRGKAAS